MLFTLYSLRSNLMYKMCELIIYNQRCNILVKLKKHYFYIFFIFFQLMARNMLLVWSAQSQNAVQRLLDQAMLVCTFVARSNVKWIKLTMNRTQLLNLLHSWIFLIESIFLVYAHIWIKYLCTANLTHSYTNLLSTICFEHLDV